MDIGLIIIIIVVISIIMSAVKKNKPQQKNEEEAQATPRPPTMSDIQKAFRMMANPDNEGQQTPPRQANMNGMESRLDNHLASSAMKSRLDETLSGEGQRGHEGLHGRHEGLHGHEGLPGHEGLHGHEGLPGHEGLHGRHEGLHGDEGQRGHEGLHGSEGKAAMNARSSAKSRTAAKPNKYANVEIGNYTLDEEDDESSFFQPRKKEAGLALFKNQSDYAKAVIYSEILTRRTPKRYVKR